MFLNIPDLLITLQNQLFWCLQLVQEPLDHLRGILLKCYQVHKPLRLKRPNHFLHLPLSQSIELHIVILPDEGRLLSIRPGLKEHERAVVLDRDLNHPLPQK